MLIRAIVKNVTKSIGGICAQMMNGTAPGTFNVLPEYTSLVRQMKKIENISNGILEKQAKNYDS